MDGVVKNQSYYEWLKNQPKAYQVEVLGKKKAKLFQESSVDEFKEFDKNLRPMTLDEIKAQL
ncbi:hypothetical protein [Moraxella catarrhalis]|nr:hypothetical protein [Moraxella catarrhalis]